MSKKISVTICVIALILVLNCSKNPEPAAPSAPVRTTFDVTALDRTTDACDDFYQFACGSWIQRTELPAGYSRWTRFNEIDDANTTTLRQILETLVNSKSEEPNGRKLADFYTSCLGDSGVENSRAVLSELLTTINGIESKQDFFKQFPRFHELGINIFFGVSVGADEKNSSLNIAQVVGSGLGLPDRDYYFPKDESSKAILAKYGEALAKLLALAGVKDSTAKSARIVKLETELAEKSLTKVEKRDPEKTYNPMPFGKLSTLAPQFPWAEYGSYFGFSESTPANVIEVELVKRVGEVLDSTPLDTLKDYLVWQTVLFSAPRLPAEFDEAHFEFFGKALQGTKEQLPRWKRCVNITSETLGEALGEYYVKEKYGPEAKKAMEALIVNLRQAVNSNFSEVPWMDEATREQARFKLLKLGKKIGHPEKIIDYSSVNISRDSYLQNILASNVFESQRFAKKVGQAVDPNEWEMTAQTVNAYFHPNRNEIVFPAAILQNPFFMAEAPIASHYGGIGMVIGHEITHAFDDQGRQYDGDGNLKDWWTEKSAAEFSARTSCVENQYANYQVSGGVHLNGKATLGENIADLGGVKLSYKAFQEALKSASPQPAVEGFTPEQQFFLSFAQVWCAKQTPESEQFRAKNDYHSLPKFRVNGVLVNEPSFSAAFGCKAGAAMNPANKCSVW